MLPLTPPEYICSPLRWVAYWGSNRLHTSQYTPSWLELCKNYQMQCISSRKISMTGLGKWLSNLRLPKGIWKQPKFGHKSSSCSSNWCTRMHCKGSSIGPGSLACRKTLNNIIFDQSRDTKRQSGPTPEKATAAPHLITASLNMHSMCVSAVWENQPLDLGMWRTPQ